VTPGDLVPEAENDLEPVGGEEAEEERISNADGADKPAGLFGGLTPREAGLRSAAKRSGPQADLDPQAKTRKALETKAGKGDVYAARELREHSDWYYGSATGDAWKALLTDDELTTVMSIFDAAHNRALSLDALPEEE
jgi:hypothetical protein